MGCEWQCCVLCGCDLRRCRMRMLATRRKQSPGRISAACIISVKKRRNKREQTASMANNRTLMADSAVVRKPSTEANHWLVARKMVGFLVRQSYGYLCSYASSRSRTPAVLSASTTAALPSPCTAEQVTVQEVAWMQKLIDSSKPFGACALCHASPPSWPRYIQHG